MTKTMFRKSLFNVYFHFFSVAQAPSTNIKGAGIYYPYCSLNMYINMFWLQFWGAANASFLCAVTGPPEYWMLYVMHGQTAWIAVQKVHSVIIVCQNTIQGRLSSSASINYKHFECENYWVWSHSVQSVRKRERRGSCGQVTGLGLRADGLSSDRQRPALHLSSSQINNRREQWATTARRDWVCESRYSKCNAIYQCHRRQAM